MALALFPLPATGLDQRNITKDTPSFSLVILRSASGVMRGLAGRVSYGGEGTGAQILHNTAFSPWN